MPNWSITAEGDVREMYSVEAETEEEARELFEQGKVDGPWFSEVQGSQIVKVERAPGAVVDQW